MKVHIYKVIIGKGSRATIIPHPSVSSLVRSSGFVRADEFNSMLRYLQQEFTRDYGGIYAEEHEPWLNDHLNAFIQAILTFNNAVANTYRLIESAIIERACEELKAEWYKRGSSSSEIISRHVHYKINQDLRRIIGLRSNPELIRLFGKMEANARQKLKN